MDTKRIEEIQNETAYPESRSVQQALLKVWNECEQQKVVNKNDLLPDVSGSALPKYDCDDCSHYPCQTEPDSHGSQQRKIEYGKCGDHSKRSD
jgi:hypothetical protein